MLKPCFVCKSNNRGRHSAWWLVFGTASVWCEECGHSVGAWSLGFSREAKDRALAMATFDWGIVTTRTPQGPHQQTCSR